MLYTLTYFASLANIHGVWESSHRTIVLHARRAFISRSGILFFKASFSSRVDSGAETRRVRLPRSSWRYYKILTSWSVPLELSEALGQRSW